MNRLSRVALLLTVTVGVLASVAPAPAQAEPIGGLIIIPGSGSDLDTIRLRTSAGCPAKADAYYARMTGQDFPPDGLVVTGNTAAGLSHRFGFDVYLAQIMRDYANENRTILGGRYDITVFCIDSFTTQSYGEFIGSLEFTSPTHYEAVGAAKPTGPPPPPLDLNGDGSALPPAAEPPPAATPPVADPPSGATQGQQAPTTPPPPEVEPRPSSAPGQLTSQGDNATGQRSPWLVPVGAVLVILLVTLVTVVVANRIRKQRSS
jgi:hypothetical protein